MIITADKIYDTLGGGQLEFIVTLAARKMINQGRQQQSVEYLSLSNKAKQCCGGTVNVLIECFAAPRHHIHVFGAGHVAKALLNILGEMECQVSWIDSRAAIFPSSLPTNTKKCLVEDTSDYIHNMPKGGIALVLTHDHSLDYSIITALLDYADCQFIGLIGSKSKALRFKKRLKSDSFGEKDINKINCPVGLQQVKGKQPMEVAVAIAGQIIQLMAQQQKPSKNCGVYWRDALAKQVAMNDGEKN